MSRTPKTIAILTHRVSSQFALWGQTFRLLWTAAPRYTTAWTVALVVQGVLPAALVYLTKLVVDSVIVAMNAGGKWEQLRPALFLVALMAGVMLISEVLQSAIEWIRVAQADLIQDHIKGLVHKKSAAVDMILYDSPEYHDRLEQVSTDAAGRPLAFLESTGSLLQHGITLLVMGAILLRYSVLLPLILLISTLPALAVVLRSDRRYHEWWKRTTADRRWAQYYDSMLTHKVAAAEMRLFGLSRPFHSAYRQLRAKLRAERLSQLRKQGLGKLGAAVIALLVSGATMAWMGWRAVNGVFTLGDLALFYQALNRGQGLMRSLLGSVGQIYKNSLFLEALFEFLNLKSTIQDPTEPVTVPQRIRYGIDFRNITFRYPGTQQAILQNFSLFIPAGRIVVLVGENGAGKTTLLKLLCRLYDPEAGAIELDGVDIRNFRVEDLWRLITITFQMPLNYHALVGDSIAMGDLEANPTRVDVETAAKNAGAHDFIERLPLGYDTLLGKVHADGMELSSGQWQRLAMARAYLRKAPLILLDEPTSFMDSWSEADWFNRLRRLSENRTALVVTHRFTIAMRADVIHVMDHGKIVESGGHSDLIECEGLYAQSWMTQMQPNARPRATVLADDLSLENMPAGV